MEVYLVGGAVRDELLGRPVLERDWVVVGATPEQMEQAGFRPVGRDFPVFLHPDTGEEYALARTERKTARGYRGFQVYATPDVTLEQDLLRRDLTVNAIARGGDGELLDPHGGVRDLEDRILRHVSPAFIEDPVRVLRVARFAALLADLGFSVAADTQTLMARMVESGELDALVPERVWQETRRSLETDRPEVFFETLKSCGALACVFPELDSLFGAPDPAASQTDGDAGIRMLEALGNAVRLTPQTRIRFAALVHGLRAGEPPADTGSTGGSDEERGGRIVAGLCSRLRIPNDFRDLAVITTRFHQQYGRAAELDAEAILALLEGTDAFRRPGRFAEFLTACEAIYRTESASREADDPRSGILARALDAAATARPAAGDGLSGKEIGERLRVDRLRALASIAATPAARPQPK